MNAQNTYAVALLMCQDYESALREYDHLHEIYLRQHRTINAEYATMRNNTPSVLEKLGRLTETGDIMLEVLELDQKIFMPESLYAGHFRNTANILSLLGKDGQAIEYAEKALTMRTDIYCPDSPWTADIQAVCAWTLFCQGQTQRATELIESSCQAMAEHARTL